MAICINTCDQKCLQCPEDYTTKTIFIIFYFFKFLCTKNYFYINQCKHIYFILIVFYDLLFVYYIDCRIIFQCNLLISFRNKTISKIFSCYGALSAWVVNIFWNAHYRKIILEAPNKHRAHMCLQNLQFNAAKILPRGLENLSEINGQDNTFFVYTFDLD